MSKSKKKLMVSISARVPKEMSDDLKLVCIHLSKARGKVFSVSELLRETLLPFCPEDKRKRYFE